jgi:hypothetical protein
MESRATFAFSLLFSTVSQLITYEYSLVTQAARTASPHGSMPSGEADRRDEERSLSIFCELNNSHYSNGETPWLNLSC